MRLYPNRPLFIVSNLTLMLSPIKFNYQLLFDAGEVGNVPSNRVLTTKAIAIKLFPSQSPPQ